MRTLSTTTENEPKKSKTPVKRQKAFKYEGSQLHRFYIAYREKRDNIIKLEENTAINTHV